MNSTNRPDYKWGDYRMTDSCFSKSELQLIIFRDIIPERLMYRYFQEICVVRLVQSRGVFRKLLKTIKRHGLIGAIWYLNFLTKAYLKCRRSIRRHKMVGESDLLAAKKSDTVFVLGSGASINAITESEWKKIAENDVLTVNYSCRQTYVPVGFHYIREVEKNPLSIRRYDDYELEQRCLELANIIKFNPRYDTSILFVQKDYFAEVGAKLFNSNALKDFRIYGYNGRHIDRRQMLATRPSLKLGIPRCMGALGAALYICACMRWKNVILIGFDLNNSQYFWLEEGEKRNVHFPSDPDKPHPTAKKHSVEFVGHWASMDSVGNQRIYVSSEKSMLSRILPVWTF